MVNQHPFNTPVLSFMLIEQLLSRPGYNIGDPLSGNVAESWSANEDNTEFTFTIREGLRWSDGTPVTTEDVRYTFEDFFLNDELNTTYFIRNRSLHWMSSPFLRLELVPATSMWSCWWQRVAQSNNL